MHRSAGRHPTGHCTIIQGVKPAARTVTVMVVDDNKEFRDAMRDLLEGEPGFRVVAEAVSGRQAVDMYARTSPDVVVMDIRMTELDGIEATRQLRRKDPQASVVLVTVGTLQDIPEAARECGAAAVLGKPEIKSSNLFPLLRRVQRDR
jgi:DNA-binding NarL/FixJ family response regulator